MEKTENKKLEFYLTKSFGFVPLAVFIISLSYFILTKAFTMEAFIAFGVLGLVVGVFFAKDWSKYFEAMQKGFTKPSLAMIIGLFLIVGLFTQMMVVSRITEGFVWLGNSLALTGALFCAFTFVAVCIITTATGTSIGAIVAGVPIFYPAGVLLGAGPIFILGAILSGAAFGDNLAPISDTTILSAKSQEYTRKKGTAEIGGVVSSRFKYAIIAAVIAFVLYLTFGGGGSMGVGASEILEAHMYPLGLIMLIPVGVVLYIAMKYKALYPALIGGIVSGAVVGMLFGILTPSDFIYIENGAPAGIIPTGVGSMLPTIMIAITLFGMIGIMEESGVLDDMVKWLTTHVTGTPRRNESAIFGGASLLNLVAPGGMLCVMFGPIANKIGQKMKIHPYRRANIVDAVSCSWAFFIPIGIYLFVLTGILGGVQAIYEFVPIPALTDYFFVVFYPLVLWFVIGFSVITGFGREFEGKGGKRVKRWFSNKVPEEAL